MLKFIMWLILFVLCWPLAIFGLLVYPIVWLLSLPFRLFGIVVTGIFAFIKGIILLPARILGQKPS